MLLSVCFIILGFILLIWSADIFIQGAASIAANLGMSTLMIGLTIVALGTSAPEILVSFLAALEGSGDIAAGNAIGSNITNVGLVLGITALVAAIPVNKRLIRIDLPILFLVMLAAGAILYDYKITLPESLGLIVLLCLYIFFLYLNRDQGTVTTEDEEEVTALTGLKPFKAWLYFALGLIVLVGSAQLLVKGAVTIARIMEIPELVIGVTIIALGTSLPELAASVTGALKGHHDIAFGNVVGSNIFNLLVVLAMPGFVTSAPLDPAVLTRDFMTMLLLTLMLFIMLAFLCQKGKHFGKTAGLLLLSGYGVYYAIIFQQLT